MLGQSFRIVNADSRTGTFSSLEGANIGGGLAYTVQYDATGATLVVGETAFPQVSIDDVSVTEGDTGTTNATFTVTLSSAATDTRDGRLRDRRRHRHRSPPTTRPRSGTLTFPPA